MNKTTCSVDGCTNFCHSAGYCKVHYTRWRRHGDPLVTLRKAAALSSNGPCKIDGCTKPFAVAGTCPMHYERMRKYGTYDSPRPSVEQRLLAKVRKTSACWIWEASTDSRGYGQLAAPSGSGSRQAHRIAYELWVEAIPDGMEVDHICLNRGCVNPDHLRLATRKQNLEHRSGATRVSRSGVRGVSWSKGRWLATVGHHGKKIYLGRFLTIEEAEAVVIAKRNELFTHNVLDRVA